MNDLGFLSVIIVLVIIGVIFSALALLFVFILNSITNTQLRKAVFILLTIFFLPIMLFVRSSLKLTDAERALAPFSFDLHVRSKLITLTSIVYIAIYAYVFFYIKSII